MLFLTNETDLQKFTLDFAEEVRKNTNVVLIIDCTRQNIFIQRYIDYLKQLLKISNVNFITIAAGQIAEMGFDLFVLGDERFILPGTCVYASERNILQISYGENWLKKGYSLTEDEASLLTTGGFKEAIKYLEFNSSYSTSSILEVDNQNMLGIVNYVLICHKMGKKEAVLKINSGGGRISYLKLLEALVKELDMKLVTIGLFNVSSSTAIIFLLGDRRYLSDGTIFTLHEPRTEFKANVVMFAEELRFQAERLEKDNDYFMSVITKRSKISEVLYKQKTSNHKDWEIAKAEWEELGIITGAFSEAYKYL